MAVIKKNGLVGYLMTFKDPIISSHSGLVYQHQLGYERTVLGINTSVYNILNFRCSATPPFPYIFCDM